MPKTTTLRRSLLRTLLTASLLLGLAPATASAAEPAFRVIYEGQNTDAGFQAMKAELVAALKADPGLKLLAKHDMDKMGISRRTFVAEVCNDEVKKAVTEIGGPVLLTAPWEMAISPLGDRLVLTILNPKVVSWAFFNHVAEAPKAKALAAFEGLVAQVQKTVQAGVKGKAVSEGAGPSYEATDLDHIQPSDYSTVVYQRKATSHDPVHDLDEVLERTTHGVWLTPKWKVTEVFRPSPKAAMFGLCHKGYATKALSMGAYHAAALPCTAAVWLEGRKLQVAMLEPQAIFGIFFRDAPVLAFAENMTLPGDVSDQIARGLTKELGQKPGKVVGKPKWFGWGQLQFQEDLGEQGGEPIPSTFEITRMRFGVKGLAKPYWEYHFMVDASTRGVRLMNAWTDWRLHDALQLRLGQFKHGFGREATPRALLWKFHSPSYVTAGIAGKMGRQGGSYRDMGVMAHGKSPLGPVGLSYRAFLMQGNGINTTEVNDHKDLVAHLGLELPFGITLGGSYYRGAVDELRVVDETTGEQAAQALGEQAFGVDVAVRTQRLTLQAEYMRGGYEALSGDDIVPDGYYVSGTFFIFPWLEAGARWDTFTGNAEATTVERKSRTTFSLGLYFDKLNRISVNYELRNDDANPDLEDFLSLQVQGIL